MTEVTTPAIALLGHGGMPWAYPESKRCIEKGGEVISWNAEPMLQALERRHTEDTWFQAITVPEPDWPRMSKQILRELTGSPSKHDWRTGAPVLSYAVLDLDRPDHRSDPWPDAETARKALADTLQQLAAGGWPDAWGYATRGGLRVGWLLEGAVPIALAQSFLDQLHLALPPGLPVSVDEGVKDWTRGYRVPWCPRKDGKRPAWGDGPPPMILDALRAGRALSWWPDLKDETIPEPRVVVWPARPAAETPADKRIRPCVEKWATEIAASSSRHAVLLAKCKALGGLCQGGIDRGFIVGPDLWLPLLVAAAGDSNDADDAAWDAVSFGAGIPWWFEDREAPKPIVRSPNRPKESPMPLETKEDRAVETPAAPHWIESFRNAVVTGDAGPIYGNPAALVGLVRPGVLAGEVEQLMAQLPHAVRAGLRRAGKAIAAETPRARKEKQEKPPSPLPVVVEHGSSIWVHDPPGNGYLVCSPRAAAAEVSRLHGLDCRIHGENSSRLMSPTELYDVHGVTASRLQWSYCADGPTWDASTRTIVLPGAKVRNGDAEYSEAVAQWLFRFVAPSQVEKFLDWLATADQLDRPTSAPQFRGPGSAGKGMLVAALVTWLGGRTDYRHATGDFNAGLIHGPVIVLDEGIAESQPNAFRSLTGNDTHPVMAKNRMPEELYGCPRVVVTSNEPDPLRLGREELSAWSEEALGRRILVFDVQQGATDYLAEMGGWTSTAGWCAPDGALVKHLRWLADARKVVPGKRFLVEGDASEWVANAHRRSGVAGDIVQAWEAYEDMGNEGRSWLSSPLPFIDGPTGPSPSVGMSVAGLQANWQKLVGSNKVPSHRRLAEVLQRLSGQVQSIQITRPDGGRSPRVYLVPKDRLIDKPAEG